MIKPVVYGKATNERRFDDEPRLFGKRGSLTDRFIEVWAFGRYLGIAW